MPDNLINDPIPNLGLLPSERAQPLDLTGVNPGFLGRNTPAPKVQPNILTAGGITPYSQLPQNDRYPYFFQGMDNEDLYGNAQSTWDKFRNASVNLAGLAGTTFLQGTAGVVNGIFQAAYDQRFSSFYDNEFTRAMDEFNKENENKYAAYYTNREADADFFSTDNLFTANFLFDKVYKNLGFALGAMASGGAWNSALKAVGLFSKAAAAGGAAEAAIATEQAMAAPVANRLAQMTSKLGDVASKFAYNYKNTNIAQRAVVDGLATIGEASIEALEGLQTFRNQAIRDYTIENGFAPSGEELQRINETAEKIGNFRFGMNVALLTATNYIQMPKILGSSFNERKIISEFAEDINKVKNVSKFGEAAKYEAVAPKTFFGRRFKNVKDAGGLLFSGSEAFEEAGQFVIGSSVESFWNKKYQNGDPIKLGFLDTLFQLGDFATNKDGLISGIQQLNTKEGLKSALIGGLSGGIMEVKQTISGRNSKKANTAKAIQAWNNSTADTFFKDLSENHGRAAAIQEERAAALRRGDFMEARNLEQDYLFTYVAPRIKYGRADLVQEEMDEIVQLTHSEEGRKVLQERGILNENTTPETIMKKAEQLKQAASRIQKTYETLNVRYGAQKTEDGKPKYSKESLDKLVYANFKIQDYDERLPKIAADLANSGVIVDPYLVNSDKEGKEDELMTETLKLSIDNNTKLLDSQKEEIKRSVDDAIAITNERKKLVDEYNDILKNPEKYTEGFKKPNYGKTENLKTESIKFKYDDVELEYETNTPYIAIYRDGVSLDKQIVLGSEQIRILGINPDGTIKYINEKGEEKDIKKEDFEKNFRLVHPEDVKKDKELAFFINNRNQVVIKQHKLRKGKDKGKVIEIQGVLDYDYKIKTLIFQYTTPKGKLVREGINSASFKPLKKFFKKGLFYFPGKELTAIDWESINSVNLKDSIKQAQEVRFNALKELIETSEKRKEELDETLAQKKAKLHKIKEELIEAEKNVQKKGTNYGVKYFDALFKKQLQSIVELTKLKRDLEIEIPILEAEREEINELIEYYFEEGEDLFEIDTLDPSYEAYVKTNENLNELKYEAGFLVEFIKDQIKNLQDTLKSVNKTIESTRALMREVRKELEKKYPEVPFGEFIEGYLDLANPDPRLLEKYPNLIKDILDTQEFIAGLEFEYLNPQLKSIQPLVEQLEQLSRDLETAERDLFKKTKIFNKFQEIFEKKEDEYRQLKQIAENKAFHKALFEQNTNDGAPATPPGADPTSIATFETKTKPLQLLFPSTTYSPADEKPHQKKHQMFLKNSDGMQNREDLEVMFVNSTTAKALGISGLVEEADPERKIDQTNAQTAHLFVVYVVRSKEGVASYVNEKGEIIGTVGEPITAKQIVFGSLPTAETTYPSIGENRYHGGTKEEAEEYSKLWKVKREELFNLKNQDVVYSPFNVSRGIPVYERDENGKVVIQRNAVENTLISATALNENKQMVHVSTSGSIKTESGDVKIPVGTVVLRNKSTIEFLDNRNFTEAEVDLIYKLLKLFVKKANVLDGTFDKDIISFLHGILYFSDNKSKEGEENAVGRNQIFFRNGMFVIGRNKQEIPFSVTSLEENEGLIKTFLRGAYMNVSNSYLKNTEKTYTEILEVDEKTGEMKTFEWKSYQHFLLSKTYVGAKEGQSLEGKSRENIPLTTSVAIPKEGENTHVSKYSSFPNTFNFETPKSEAKKEKKEEPKKKGEKKEETFEGVEFDNTKPGFLYISAKSKNGKTYKYKIIYDQVSLVSVEDETGTPVTLTPEETKKAEDFAKKRFASVFQENPKNKQTKDTEIVELGNYKVFVNINKASKKLEIIAIISSVSGNTIPIDDDNYKLFYADIYEDAFGEVPSVFPQNKIAPVVFKIPTKTKEEEETASIDSSVVPSVFEGKAEETEKLTNLEKEALIREAEESEDVDESAYSRVLDEEVYVKADFEKEVSWIKEKLGIPVKRLTQLIKATGGGYAWGMFKNNAIHLYEGMTEGVGYHEAFEAVWAMFLTPKEQDALIKEFKRRKGGFIDRVTGKTTSYNEATPDQIREQMSEEFKEFVLTGEMPKFEKAERKGLLNFFKELIAAIKNLFFGDPLTEITLFEKINAGYFKEALPVNSIPENEERYSRVVTLAGFDEADTYKIVKSVTSYLIGELINKKKSIMNLSGENFDAGELYDAVFAEIKAQLVTRPVKRKEDPKLIDLKLNTFLKIQKDWENVKTLTNEFLKTQNLINKEITEEDFNEDEEAANEVRLAEERKFDESENNNYGGRNSDSYVRNVFTIDGKLSSPAALKLVLSTIAESQFVINEEKKLNVVSATTTKQEELNKVKPIRVKIDTNVFLPKIINYAKIFNQLLSQMSELNSHSEKMNRLKELRNQFPEYVRLGNRLALDSDELTKEDWELRILFHSTFSRQNPTPLINFVEDGETYIGSADLDRESDRLLKNWIENLKSKAFNPSNKLVELNTTTNKYTFNVKELPSKFNNKKDEEVVAFLNLLGITEISTDLLKRMSYKDQANIRYNAWVAYSFITKNKEITLSTSKSLDVSGPLKSIANSLIKNLTDTSDSTFYNIEGKKVQRYVLHNTFSVILNEINQADTLEELYEKLPHLKQPTSQNSEYLKRVFNENGFKKKDEGGNPIKLSLSYVQGTIDKTKQFGNPRIATDKLDLKRRYLQEINQNMAGNWYILLPGDSQTEWMLSLDAPIVDFSRLSDNKANDVNLLFDIFSKYMENESQKGVVHDLMTHYGQTDLRKTIELYLADEIKYGLSQAYANNAFNSDFISKNFVNNPFDGSYVSVEAKENETEKQREARQLENEKRQEAKLKEEKAAIEKIIRWRAINYAINQVEMTKLFFGDLSYYKEITKRAKSFGGQREIPFEDAKFDEFANKKYNEGLIPGDPGYVDFKANMRTITTNPVLTEEQDITDDTYIKKEIRNSYAKNDVDDGQSRISLPGYKQLMLKTSRWSDKHEAKYKYILALDRLALAKDGHFSYEGRDELKKNDEELVKYGPPNDVTFNIIKPIGSGFATDNTPFLDKTSMAPISYSAYRGTNLAALYIKMWKSNLDYQIATTGRKVFNTKVPVAPFYEKDGTVSNAAFDEKSIIGIPMKFFGIQVETQGEKDGGPRGTQATKLATVNLVDSGGNVVVGDTLERKQEIKKLIDTNKRLIDEYSELGYQELLDDLGLSDENGEFVIIDHSKLLDFIKGEIERRELPSNLKQALALNEDGTDFAVPLETLPNYMQIKNLLYSQLDKKLVRPKMKGGPYIQMSSAGLEDLGAREFKKRVYTSAKLKFYKAIRNVDGKITQVRKAQIMLPAWFGRKIMNELRNAGIQIKDEKKLLEYLKKSPNFVEIMEAVGFRIPTQEINSIEALAVVGFLPEWMGQTVMVPEAITTKAGSDFDVDKLNMYLKNIYIDGEGMPKVVKYFEDEEQHSQYYKSEFEKISNAEKKRIEEKIEKNTADRNIFGDIMVGTASDKDIKKHKKRFEKIKGDMSDAAFENMFIRRLEKLGKKLSEITDADVQTALLLEFVDDMRKKSIQNEYFKTLLDILTLPENFERLIQPNTSDDLKDLRDSLTSINPKVFGGGRIKSILSSEFMSKLRHYFIVGKRGVGIAAVNQTNQAISQLSGVVLNEEISKSIKIPHNKRTIQGVEYSNISGILDRAGRYITDKISQYINGYVDISKDPFIIQIGASMSVSSIYLVMEKLGIPSDTVVYFMNQPYLRKYFEGLTASDKTYANNRRAFGDTIGAVEAPTQEEADMMESILTNSDKLNEHLIEMLKEEAKVGVDGLSPFTRKLQMAIAEQFFLFADIADALFVVTQGTNHDTANILDANMAHRKKRMKEKALAQTKFLNVNDMLNKTHVGLIAENSEKGTKAISSIFKLDSGGFRETVNELLDVFIDNYFLTSDQFNYIGKKIEQSMLNYLVQLANRKGSTLMMDFERLLVSQKENIAAQLTTLQQKMKDGKIAKNLIVEKMKVSLGNRGDGVHNVFIEYEGNDVFTLDLYLSSMKELKNNPHTAEFYSNLVKANFLQTGLANSGFSFNKSIPISDFVKMIEPVLLASNNKLLLDRFLEIGAFFRNSWNDETIIPVHTPKAKHYYAKDGSFYKGLLKENNISEDGYGILKVYTSSRNSKKPFIAVRRKKQNINWAEANRMKKQGDNSFWEVVLMRRVNDVVSGEPLELGEGTFTYNVFLPVSAWGNGSRAYESYTQYKQSSFNNGTFKPTYIKDVANAGKPNLDSAEISDEAFSDYLNNTSDATFNNSGKKVINVQYNLEESATNTKKLSNLAFREFDYTGEDGVSRHYFSVEQAYQSNKNGKFDQEVYDDYMTRGGFGVKISKPLTKEGMKNNLSLMESLVVNSFTQNLYSEAANKLLEYDTFTHFGKQAKESKEIDKAFLFALYKAKKEVIARREAAKEKKQVKKEISKKTVEIFKGFWKREEVAKQTNKVFLFGDNTNDRVNTKYIPSSTQAVIRGLVNAIGIDTKKDRGIGSSSYLKDSDFNEFKKHLDAQIQLAKNSGKIIVIPEDGIGTGKAMLKEKAPKLFKYLQQELNKLKDLPPINIC